MQELFLYENPRKRRHSRRKNPMKALAMPKSLSGWTQGVDMKDIGAGLAGLAAATMLPGFLIKTTPVTTTQKLTKVGVSILSALGAGFVVQKTLGSQAAKAAVIGGLAGSAAQVLATFTGVKIGNPLGNTGIRQITGRPMGAMGDPTVVDSFRNTEKVQIIQP
jgi:hypothetical protein